MVSLVCAAFAAGMATFSLFKGEAGLGAMWVAITVFNCGIALRASH